MGSHRVGPLRGQRVPVRKLVTGILRKWDMEALVTTGSCSDLHCSRGRSYSKRETKVIGM